MLGINKIPNLNILNIYFIHLNFRNSINNKQFEYSLKKYN